MMYTFHEESPSVKVYNKLRKLVGWGSLDEAAIEFALSHSIYFVLAKFDNETIGFARVIGDGKLCFYIQEIIVHPDHQRNKIATRFMEYILEYLDINAVKRSYIGVFSGKGLEKFYCRYGFWEKPTEMMGPGMMQFWNDPEFNRHFNGT